MMNLPTASQKRIVIVGATGMVGGYALRYALENSRCRKCDVHWAQEDSASRIPSSRRFCIETSRTAPHSRRRSWVKTQRCFAWARIPGAVSDAELRTITADYTIEFARVLHRSSPGAAFSFLSGNGADPTGRSRMPFARYKGEAENALLAAGFPHVYLFRPAYIYPVQPRKEPNFSYRFLRGVYPLFRLLFPNQVIRADDLARAMVVAAVSETGLRGGPVFENREIRAMVECLQALQR